MLCSETNWLTDNPQIRKIQEYPSMTTGTAVAIQSEWVVIQKKSR